LVVSELLVMAGEERQGLALAHEARELSPSLALAHRQARALSLRNGDTQAALEILDNEVRTLEQTPARAHALLVGAALAKISIGDEDAAKKRVELAARLSPADPRAHVQKIAEI